MSEREHDGQPAEQRSSVSISRNAKGEAQFAVKAYEGCEVDELTRLRELAVSNYRELYREFYGAA
jgi:hypothetical protein